MAINYNKTQYGIEIVGKSASTSTLLGDLEVLTSSNKLHFHNGSTNSPVVTEAHTATLTNKTIDADLNTLSNIEDADIKVGAAIARAKLASGSAYRLVINDGSGVMVDASAIVASRLIISDSNGIPTNHVAIVANRALASNASGFPVESSVTDTELSYVSGVTSSIQTQINSKADDSAFQAHIIATTGTHGVTGNIVGTSDVQVLTNKDIDGGVASNSRRITLPQDTKANLDALNRKAATLVYANDQSLLYVDNGSTLSPVGGNFITYPTESISSGGTISMNTVVGLQYRRVAGNGGPVVASNVPFGAGAATDGIIIRLVGTDNDNTVSLINNNAPKGAILNGDATLGFGDVITLQYDAILDRYVEIERNF